MGVRTSLFRTLVQIEHLVDGGTGLNRQLPLARGLPLELTIEGVAAIELGVLEAQLAGGAVSDFVEVIHVELPDEGGKVAMPEVSREDAFFEGLEIANGKRSAICIPPDDARGVAVLEHIVEAVRKRQTPRIFHRYIYNVGVLFARLITH